jgi:hypothetical protein
MNSKRRAKLAHKAKVKLKKERKLSKLHEESNFKN